MGASSFPDPFVWIIKNGKSVLFWEDHWLNGGSLAIKFPRLYNLSVHQLWSVKQVKEYVERKHILGWSRALRAWEKEEEEEILQTTNGITLEEGEDKVLWGHSSSPHTSKKEYKALNGEDQNYNANWEIMWRFKVPPKGNIFFWKLMHGEWLQTGGA